MRLIEPDQRNFDEIHASFRWEIPTHFNIAYEVCDKHMQRSNDIALFYENGRGDTKSFTFGRIKSLSDRFANALRALGVSRGDRVAIILSQRVETGIAHLAIYKIGAIALPLSILFGHDALEYRLRDSGAKVVITGTIHSDMT